MSNREEVDGMIATVDDLLVLARADEGGLRLNPVPIDLRELAGRAVQRLGPHARRYHVELAADGPSASVSADPARLDQVLRNLIDNAIKFSASGQVTVRTWQTTREAGVTVRMTARAFLRSSATACSIGSSGLTRPATARPAAAVWASRSYVS